MILDPAKLTVTVSHNKTLQQDPGPEPPSFGIFAGKRKRKGSASPCLTLEHAHGVTQILSPYSHSRIAKVPPVQTRAYRSILVSSRPWGRLQVSSRPLFYRVTEEGNSVQSGRGELPGWGDVRWGGIEPPRCAVWECVLQFSGYSWGTVVASSLLEVK